MLGPFFVRALEIWQDFLRKGQKNSYLTSQFFQSSFYTFIKSKKNITSTSLFMRVHSFLHVHGYYSFLENCRPTLLFVSLNFITSITSDALNFEVNTVLYYYCIYFEI